MAEYYCTGCFGPINGPICWVNGMPYHSQSANTKKGFSRSSLCAPPIGTPPPPPPPIPGQIDLDGQIAT